MFSYFSSWSPPPWRSLQDGPADGAAGGDMRRAQWRPDHQLRRATFLSASRGYFFSPSFQPPLATLCVCNTPSTTRGRRRFFNSLFSLKLADWLARAVIPWRLAAARRWQYNRPSTVYIDALFLVVHISPPWPSWATPDGYISFVNFFWGERLRGKKNFYYCDDNKGWGYDIFSSTSSSMSRSKR